MSSVFLSSNGNTHGKFGDLKNAVQTLTYRSVLQQHFSFYLFT